MTIPAVEKNTDARSTGKGGINARDSFLFRKKPEVISVFQEHFHQIGTSTAAALQQGLKGGTPGLREGFSQ